MVQVPPTGETEKGADQLWVSAAYFRTHPAGCFDSYVRCHRNMNRALWAPMVVNFSL